MPGRQSHGGAPSKAPKQRVNNKKRALNAYATAAQQYPDKIKIRQSRLGTSEGGNRPGKRPRADEDVDEEEDGSSTKKPRKGEVKGRFDQLDVDGGSDSEGNEWRLGQVDSDDDSDLDSDEAFGESDEERFEGFAFSGGSSKKKIQAKRTSTGTVTLNEENEESNMDSESDDDSLGSDAIDLADMLDATEEDDEKPLKKKGNEDHDAEDGESEGDSGGESDDSEESSMSSIEDNDYDDPDKIDALQDLIASLPQADHSTKAPQRQRADGASEYATPSDYGVTSKKKLTLEDLGLPTVRDPFVKKSLKMLAADSKGLSKSKKLEVPLSKREQDRLDRSAAYDKSKETLSKWTATVRHNRQAEHLVFPLPDPDVISAKSNAKLQLTTNSKPFTDLEATIQSILEESGLATADGRDDEDKLMAFEELETNKMSIEEVKARRDQLRMARDLMFREEARSKRIKKIKSKSYRKVHRKQREKEERLNNEALLEAGVGPDEDEEEAQDRRRAEERMGARHRGSKWAKANKETGRAAWDEDARAGITDMARRDEELRKRVEGRTSRRDGAEATDSSESEDYDSDVDDDNDSRHGKHLLQRLDNIGDTDVFAAESAPGSKLANMKFMLKADAAKRKENDATVRQIRKELAGEDSSDENEFQGDIGRRVFGPGSSQFKQVVGSKRRTEFEDPEASDVDLNTEKVSIIKTPSIDNDSVTKSTQRLSRRDMTSFEPAIASITSEGGAWSRGPTRTDAASTSEVKRRKQKLNADVEELDFSNVATIATKVKPKKKITTKTTTLQVEESSDEENDAENVHLPFAIRDQELIKRAFAGADVVGEFDAEKRQTIEDDEEKIIDNTLPGWGNWTGNGLSKKDKKKNKGRFLSKTDGIKEQNRKDAKLERVIVNEKRIKKNGKYLASSLPHPFESRQQYERSLRLPVGPEWTTKETFQDATKPRILLKQGIIAPMSKPLI